MKTLVCLLLLCAVSQASLPPDLSFYQESADIILLDAFAPPNCIHTYIYADGSIVRIAVLNHGEDFDKHEGWTSPALVEELIVRAKDTGFHSQSWQHHTIMPIITPWVVLTFPKLPDIKYECPFDEPLPSAMSLRESVQALIKNADWKNK